MKKYLVFDLGGTLIKHALMNEEGEILARGSVKTPDRSVSREDLFAVLDEIAGSYEYDGIAVSSPGILDSGSGIINTVAVFPCLNGCHFKEEAQERYHVPVSIENDGKCAALAEVFKGNLQDVQDGAVMVLGTAVGGAVILDGKLRRGKHQSAGEFSGMCINFEKPYEKESYEAMLGVKGLIRRVKETAGTEYGSGTEVFDMIEAGDLDVYEGLVRYCQDLAMAIFSLNLALDLERVLIGGGISRRPVLIKEVKKAMERLDEIHPDLRQGVRLPKPEVDVCRYWNDSNLVGALYHHLCGQN